MGGREKEGKRRGKEKGEMFKGRHLVPGGGGMGKRGREGKRFTLLQGDAAKGGRGEGEKAFPSVTQWQQWNGRGGEEKGNCWFNPRTASHLRRGRGRKKTGGPQW